MTTPHHSRDDRLGAIPQGRLRADEELGHWLRAMLASAGEAVMTTDADGRVTLMNAVAEALTGWPQTEALGHTLTDVARIAHETSQDLIENPVLRALQTGEIVKLAKDTILISRHGDDRPIAGSVAPSRDASGATIGTVFVFRDVSDGRTSAGARAHLAAIVDSSEDAIVSKSLQGVVQSWNAGAERLFEYTAEEAIGRPITFLIPPARRHEEDDILKRIARGERLDHFETVRMTKSGRLLDISLTISPIRDDSGRIIGASKIARDITDRKRAEEALKETHRQKDRFIALLAHELRNPLAPLKTALHVMQLAEGRPDQLARARDVMGRQLGHLVRLIDDLLDISRIGQNKLELRRAKVALTEVVNHAVETARPLIDDAGHELTISLPATPVYLDGDLTRLSQVLSNLLTNSAKYTERGGAILLAAERRGGEVVISVRDTGIGIPADALERVFDMFAQIDRGLERAKDGLGIGLALVKGLVQMHGGSVTAASRGPGTGSTFTITLPVLPVSTSSSDAAAPAPPVSLPPQRILIVDDNRDAADSMASMLELMGQEVQTVYSGADAIDAAASFRPAVIFMDIGMPGLSGYEATRQIRAQAAGHPLKVIALTGWGQEHDRAQSRAAGCDDHLVKPIDLAELVRLLRA